MKSNLGMLGTMLVAAAFSLASCSGEGPDTYDGTWSGTTSQGENISFTVVNNRITSIAMEYTFRQCDYAATDGLSSLSSAITGNRAAADLDFVLPVERSYRFRGEFISPSSASGTCAIIESCGALDITWNAERNELLNVTGTWAGTYSTDLLPSGAMTMHLAQSPADALDGDYRGSGDREALTGTVSGVICGDFLFFGLDQTTPDCRGSFYGIGRARGNALSLSFSGSDCLGSHGNGQVHVARE